MEELLKQILGKLDNLDKRFDGIDGQLKGINGRLDTLKNNTATIASQVAIVENTMVTNDIFNKSVVDTQKDIGIIMEKMATKNSVDDLRSSLKTLNTRSINKRPNLQR